MQNLTSHSSSPTTTSKILPWPSLSPDLTQTHLEQVGDTCSRQSEHPWKCARVVSSTEAGVGGHPSTSDLQPDPGLALEMQCSYWFRRKTHPQLMCCHSVTKCWVIELFFDQKSVIIINSDLNQLQNKIWWTWFIVEFLNNKSIVNWIWVSFLTVYVGMWVCPTPQNHFGNGIKICVEWCIYEPESST